MISQKLHDISTTLSACVAKGVSLDRGDLHNLATTLESIADQVRHIEREPIRADLRMEFDAAGNGKVVAISAYRKNPRTAIVPFPGPGASA